MTIFNITGRIVQGAPPRAFALAVHKTSESELRDAFSTIFQTIIGCRFPIIGYDFHMGVIDGDKVEYIFRNEVHNTYIFKIDESYIRHCYSRKGTPINHGLIKLGHFVRTSVSCHVCALGPVLIPQIVQFAGYGEELKDYKYFNITDEIKLASTLED